MYTLCCTDNEDAVLVTGEYEDPRTPEVLAMPISDNKLLIAASVYARQVSLLSCRIKKKKVLININELQLVQTSLQTMQALVLLMNCIIKPNNRDVILLACSEYNKFSYLVRMH